MIVQKTWSKKHWIAISIVGLAVWLVFASIAPGDDYKRCYTMMVMEPELLQSVAEYPWTLNPPWLAVFMVPFVSLPGRPGYIVFMLATIAIVIYSASMLGGKPIPILLSSHMMWILWWGQIEGWGILGFVLAWFAYKKKSWLLMFLAITLSSFKPQIGLVPVLLLWWWTGNERWKSLGAALALFAISIWVWGPWPVWYWQGITGFVGDGHHGLWNASLGLLALPLFIPALLLPLEKEKRILAVAATAMLVSPYMPYYSTILLFFFAIPAWAYLFGFISWFPNLLGTSLAWNSVVLLPILLLVWLYVPVLTKWVQDRKNYKLVHG